MASAPVTTENSVKKIYLTVIEEVLMNVRESFIDEGHDEQILHELKHMWETKLNASKALQTNDDLNSNGSNSTGNGGLRLPISHSKSSANETSKSKSDLDSATRSALQALPHSIYSSAGNLDRSNGKKLINAPQLDGAVDGSSSEDDDDEDDIGEGIHGDEEDDDADDDKTNNEDHSEYEGKEDPDPLNSDDDLTDQGSPGSQSDLFDTDHVIVCQYDKITRIKNRWKFHLKDGIMNINGRDYLFSKANGDAEW